MSIICFISVSPVGWVYFLRQGVNVCISYLDSQGMSSITVIVQYLLTKFRLSIFLTGPGSTSKLVPGFASRDPKDLPAVESLGGGGRV